MARIKPGHGVNYSFNRPIEDDRNILQNILRRREVHPLFAGASDGRIGLSFISATTKTEGTMGIHIKRDIIGWIRQCALWRVDRRVAGCRRHYLTIPRTKVRYNTRWHGYL